jgi:hypothetical protein
MSTHASTHSTNSHNANAHFFELANSQSGSRRGGGSWVSAEQAAQRVGEQPFSRNGICDCQNTDGMHWSLPLLGPWKRRAATPGGTLPLKRMLEPEPPTKFYKEN